MKDRLQNIADMLKSAKDIAVIAHTNPDGDAISCALAVCRALRSLGKNAVPVCDSAVPEKYLFMEGAESFVLPDKTVHEAALAVDCSDLSRLGGAGKMFLSAKKRAAIDHHKSHENFAQTDYVEADSAACAEIIYLLLDGMGLVDKTVAELVFAGIVADSGCFQYPSTTERTHDIARKLMAFGIDSADIIYRVVRRVTPSVFALKNRVPRQHGGHHHLRHRRGRGGSRVRGLGSLRKELQGQHPHQGEGGRKRHRVGIRRRRALPCRGMQSERLL